MTRSRSRLLRWFAPHRARPIVAFAVVVGLAACEPAPPQMSSQMAPTAAVSPPVGVVPVPSAPDSVAATAPAMAPVPVAAAPATAVPMSPATAPLEAPAKPAPPVAVEDPNTVRVLLTPPRETTLVAQMPGVIKLVPEQIGARIERGATLVEFDCSEQQAKLAMADAEFASARETHEAKIRLQGLQSAGEVEVALAAAARERARAQIELTKVQMRACHIEAPFSGSVVKLHAKRFQGVNAGSPVVEIVAAGPPRMKVNMPSKWLGWIRVGSNFNITVDETSRIYLARVAAINGRVDAVSQSIEIEGEVVGNAAGLLPGMSGTARFSPPR